MGYGVVARIFHWLTVLLVFTMIPVGFIMQQDLPRSTQNGLFILHKGLGVVVLVVVAARLAWRAFNPPPALPASIPRGQRRASGVVHAMLYAMLLLQAVSGYVRVTAGGFPIELLNALGVPPLLAKNEALGKAASTVHAASALLLIALIALHIAAATYHGAVRRDGVLARMWPPLGGRQAPPAVQR